MHINHVRHENPAKVYRRRKRRGNRWDTPGPYYRRLYARRYRNACKLLCSQKPSGDTLFPKYRRSR